MLYDFIDVDLTVGGIASGLVLLALTDKGRAKLEETHVDP